jgi:hypothetical protein
VVQHERHERKISVELDLDGFLLLTLLVGVRILLVGFRDDSILVGYVLLRICDGRRMNGL